MSPLEIALLVLVIIWSIIFLIIAIVLIILARGLKQALDKINHILETADGAVEGVANAGRLATGVVSNLFSSKNSSVIKKIASKALSKRRK